MAQMTGAFRYWVVHPMHLNVVSDSALGVGRTCPQSAALTMGRGPIGAVGTHAPYLGQQRRPAISDGSGRPRPGALTLT